MPKSDRVRRLLTVLDDLALTHGKMIAPRLAGHPQPSCLIDHDPRWQAQLTEDCEIAYVRTGPAVVRELLRARPGTLLLELTVRGDRKLVAHYRHEDGEISIYLMKPGLWEAWFGLDNGKDSVSILPDMFCDPNEAQWAAFVKSPDGQWPRPFWA